VLFILEGGKLYPNRMTCFGVLLSMIDVLDFVYLSEHTSFLPRGMIVRRLFDGAGDRWLLEQLFFRRVGA
jgi:hypothetical protein